MSMDARAKALPNAPRLIPNNNPQACFPRLGTFVAPLYRIRSREIRYSLVSGGESDLSMSDLCSHVSLAMPRHAVRDY